MKYVIYVTLEIVLYILLSIFVFDYSRKAYYYDRDRNDTGLEMICGPKPWSIICAPTYHEFYFDGKEWPFIIFKPICWGYARIRGCVL